MPEEFTDGSDAELGNDEIYYDKIVGATRRKRLPNGTLVWYPIEKNSEESSEKASYSRFKLHENQGRE